MAEMSIASAHLVEALAFFIKLTAIPAMILLLMKVQTRPITISIAVDDYRQAAEIMKTIASKSNSPTNTAR